MNKQGEVKFLYVALTRESSRDDVHIEKLMEMIKMFKGVIEVFPQGCRAGKGE